MAKTLNVSDCLHYLHYDDTDHTVTYGNKSITTFVLILSGEMDLAAVNYTPELSRQ